MRRSIRMVLAVTTLGMLGLVACSDEGEGGATPGGTGSIAPPAGGTASSATPGSDAAGLAELAGQIAFMRGDESQEAGVAYVVDPDGTDERQLVPEGHSERPNWSPDGTEMHINCCGDGMAAHFIDADTGEIVRAWPSADPAVELYCGASWSPDGKRVSCEGFGVDDPNLSGIYTARVSDGGGLRQITSNTEGEHIPGDFSPDGAHLVFARSVDEEPIGIFVAGLDGSEPVQVSPPDVTIDGYFGGSWSPDGSQILFVVQPSEDQHKEIWIVNSDGSSPRRLEMTPACGGSFTDTSTAGCYSPEWSPDGSMIVFTRSSWDGGTENIYIVNADGTGLFQVTDGGADDHPDWGMPPTGA